MKKIAMFFMLIVLFVMCTVCHAELYGYIVRDGDVVGKFIQLTDEAPEGDLTYCTKKEFIDVVVVEPPVTDEQKIRMKENELARAAAIQSLKTAGELPTNYVDRTR